MNARELMTKDPACCTPDTTVRDAARMMKDCDCGAIPVVENKESKKLVGIITDRDLAIRCLAEGNDPDDRIEPYMSGELECANPDDSHQRVEDLMARKQIRRIPVCDDEGRIEGIISQADLLRRDREIDDHEARETVERISEPVAAAR